MKTVQAIEHCHSIVRRHDKDRYLASLFASDDNRPFLWALYAFNYEIARVRELVSDPVLGEMRFQWWSDVIDRLYENSAIEHPVAQVLAGAIEHRALPKPPFINLIEARKFDLYNDPMPSLAQLEGYLGETSSAVIQLAAIILAGSEAANSATAAGYAGVAYGVAGLLRALPMHRARGQCYLPNDMLEHEGLSAAHVLSGRREKGLLRVLETMNSFAARRLAEARALRREVSTAALPAFLPAALIDGYLIKISRAGFDALDKMTDVPQWRRQLRLWYMARRGQF